MLNDALKDVPHISLLGTTGILFEAPGLFDLETQRRIWSLAREAAGWKGIREAAPGMTTLLLTFSAPFREIEALKARLEQAWEDAQPDHRQGKLVEVPVIYGGEYGPDLEAVAQAKGLSVDEVVAIHTAGVYPVFALGSHPGFGYLGALDPRIHMPRKKVPILRAEAGSVAIGGMQTGVSSTAGPSGWNVIGRTEKRLFDEQRNPPAVLEPGDTIRFTAQRVQK
ncbi:allophanate hydrolase [Bordetella genomosp. 10]|uniref:Allophanate hydrolase n=1 Tax=Bordetella genomosp. 10 TaxID=1416804 RepID=A0A261SM73_9BORD|nr:5-oxoprolinase subunit PxpB [Bordetella genomosp. 10]OZI37880.1 allophanate hydrolase [Bordetella genomosp. 10]